MEDKKYFFALQVTKKCSTLVLKCGEKILGEKEWQEDRDMGRRLFQAIALLLAAHHLHPEQVSDFTVNSEMPDNYTSMRIAETVKKVYTFGVSILR